MRDWLAQRARATPTADALVVPGDGAVTYAALDDRVEELAGGLSALGVGVEDHLGVCMPTRPRFVDLVHAAMRVGAVLVPLSARLTAPELADRCDRADVDRLVCDRSTETVAVEALSGDEGEEGEVVPLGEPVTIDDPAAGALSLAAVTPDTYDLPAWTLESRHVLMATSGTTGEPKVVTLTCGNLLASAAASAWRLGVLPEDRWYDTLPIYHMGGLAPVCRSVLYGTAVVVTAAGDEDQEGDGGGFDPERALAEMHATDATCVSLVPTMLRDLLDAGDLPDSLRFVLLGGAPAPDDLLERALDREVPVCPTYGATETASQIATQRAGEATDALGSVGSPLMFTDVRVVAEDGTVQPPGESGELVVSGPTVMPGYYGAVDATETAFSGDGFHTGDVGYRDEAGRLWVHNRLDDRIVTGGENVDPGEVVDALRASPDVADAAVVGLPDEEYGERVAALLVATDGDVSWPDVEADVRDRLAGFKVPRTVAFAEDLPRTASGTVDRDAVRKRLRDT
jgi:O-succinylbenzoic acid--CoA ligase